MNNKKQEEGSAYKALKRLNEELEGDELIEALMKGIPKDYEYNRQMGNDREIWYEALKEKYGL